MFVHTMQRNTNDYVNTIGCKRFVKEILDTVSIKFENTLC